MPLLCTRPAATSPSSGRLISVLSAEDDVDDGRVLIGVRSSEDAFTINVVVHVQDGFSIGVFTLDTKTNGILAAFPYLCYDHCSWIFKKLYGIEPECIYSYIAG